jgi:hypothetical protein
VIKEWVVTAFDGQQPAPATWQLGKPRVNSREALVVDLHEPISSSGEHLMAVRDGAGRRVAGHTSLDEGDSVWRFTPDRPWRKGLHALVTHPDLEDPAGNRRCAGFEQFRASEVRCDAGMTIPFEPTVRRP